MSKLSDSIFGKLSELLKSSTDDLKEFGSIDKVSEYSSISEKQDVIRRITVTVNPEDAKLVRSAVRSGSKEIVQPDMLADINKLFTDLIVGNTPKQKPKKVTKESANKTSTRLRGPSGRFISLFTLKDLLNNKLAEQIKINMGKGNAKAILNYRTGRFAQSAIINQLSRTKEGTLVAFYTYMHYPYQTFEPGFKQGLPLSRDPRLLIGKSIRQLAQEIASSRLKAIPT
jgi:hypothetical protein